MGADVDANTVVDAGRYVRMYVRVSISSLPLSKIAKIQHDESYGESRRGEKRRPARMVRDPRRICTDIGT